MAKTTTKLVRNRKSRSTRTKRKPLTKMTASELARATAELNGEFVIDTFTTPAPSAQKRWSRAKRKRGRPVKGKGSKPISVTIERTLLAKVDALARKRKTSRADLVARGLRVILQEAG